VSAQLADLTWSQAESAANAVLLVPVGATEQHGPHLPLSTDTDIAVALAERLERARPGIVVAPAISYGASGEHQDFPGTLSVGQHAIEHLLVELGRSASLTFKGIVFVSTHGGNSEPVSRATQLLRYEGREVMAWFPRWRGDLHAGRIETSVMLALAPQRVALELAVPGSERTSEDLWPLLRRSGVRAVSANGVLGDPSGASAAEGHRLIQTAVEDLIDAVTRLASAARAAALA